LTDDGGIIVSSGEGLMVKLDKNSNLEWHIERHFHHGIERGIERGTFISQIIVDGPVVMPNGEKVKDLRNDGYVIFSESGKILEEKSITQVLIDNGYEGLVFGQAWETDRIHLNDAQFIETSDSYVERGDIMLSARHISTVFLYRPRTNQVVWLKTGPFLNQHDIDYQGYGEFTIFGNDYIRSATNARLAAAYSSVYTFKMESDTIEKTLVFQEAEISIDYQGRLEKIGNNKIFVDEGVRALILSIDGKVLLRYTHGVGEEGKAGAMHWSRFLKNIPDIDF
jgi:hypothetical protein